MALDNAILLGYNILTKDDNTSNLKEKSYLSNYYKSPYIYMHIVPVFYYGGRPDAAPTDLIHSLLFPVQDFPRGQEPAVLVDLELGVVLLWGQIVVDLRILPVVSIRGAHQDHCGSHRLLLKTQYTWLSINFHLNLKMIVM